MALPRFALSFLLAAVGFLPSQGAERPYFCADAWELLQTGRPMLFEDHPACSDTPGKSYINGAVLIRKQVSRVWDVIEDAEAAPNYIEDLELARIVGTDDGALLVEQGMTVRGLRRPVTYVVRLIPHPQKSMTFHFERGRLRAMDGGWWLYPVNGGAETLLVYSLFLDPGRLAPQAMVRNSLRKKIPETLSAVKGEVLRRAAISSAR